MCLSVIQDWVQESHVWWPAPARLAPRKLGGGASQHLGVRVRGQPGLQSEFQDSQGYTDKLCLEKPKKKTKKTKKKTTCDLENSSELSECSFRCGL
jgi:hypothetical protein